MKLQQRKQTINTLCTTTKILTSITQLHSLFICYKGSCDFPNRRGVTCLVENTLDRLYDDIIHLLFFLHVKGVCLLDLAYSLDNEGVYSPRVLDLSTRSFIPLLTSFVLVSPHPFFHLSSTFYWHSKNRLVTLHSALVPRLT